MTNWCSNTVSASGDPARVAELSAAVRAGDEPFSFDAIVPEPPSVGDGWYGWRLAWWGTKWDVSQVDHDAGDGDAQWRFDTAWGPPLAAVAILSLAFPDVELQLEFSEPGNAVAGRVTFAAGRVVEDIDIDEQWPDFDEDPDGEVVITETLVEVEAARDAVTAAIAGDPDAHAAGALLTVLLRVAPVERVWHVIDLVTAGVSPDALVRVAVEQTLAGQPVPLVPVLLHHDDAVLRRVGAALFALSPLLAPPDPMRALLPVDPDAAARATVDVDELVALVTGDHLTAETVTAIAPEWAGDAAQLLGAVRALADRP